jgi:starch synthase
MKVLFAASEAAPFIKTGGLADVMGALPAQLRRQGVETALVIPKYEAIAEKYDDQMETVYTGEVDLAWRKQYLGVQKIVVNDVPVYFIDNEYYFKRSGLYGYYDDAERFAYFSKAVVEMLPHIGFKPDIIHSNDWHTGLVGVYLKEVYQKDPFYADMKSVFTIHNIKYQGIFGREVVEDVLGLPMELFDDGRIENSGCVNFLKAGMNYADHITTVSPTYAGEIRYPYFGEGLDGFVRMCAGKLSGIVNGMDENTYNPATDPYIPYKYDVSNVFTQKPLDKEALQKELGLPQDRRKPMFAMISRLVEAKGLDLVTFIMDELMQEDVQFVVVGTGDQKYEQALQALDNRYPDKVSVNIRFSEELAHKVYAAADMFLMPSRYEACGLSQMIAMKYGTVPVVRDIGGLKDTVQNYDKFSGEGNGLKFTNFNAHELLFTAKKGLGFYEEDQLWEKLVKNAMTTDNSWKKSAKAYEELYETILKKAADEKEAAPAAEAETDAKAEPAVKAETTAKAETAETAAPKASEKTAAPAAAPKDTAEKAEPQKTPAKNAAAKKTVHKRAPRKKSASAAKTKSTRKTATRAKAPKAAESTKK